MRNLYNKIKKKYIKFKEYKENKILSGEEGNEYISRNIEEGIPFFATRLGATELEILSYYLYKNKKFDKYIKEKAHKHAGVFPETNEGLEVFSQEYLNAISQADCIGVWYNKNEGNIINKYNEKCKLTELRAIEPYYWEVPWSKQLKDKKVLVIHPFKNSIESQYSKRAKLFANKLVLPEFDLKVIQAVQSMKGNSIPYDTWKDALDYMEKEIDKCDFDIAIIGAGAYGLPLGAYIKKIGKQAIHIGGATQILFGIKGTRWDNHPIISNFYNENWTRPDGTEIYSGANKVEGGCYW